MTPNIPRYFQFLTLTLISFFIISSCVPVKEITYLRDVKGDSATVYTNIRSVRTVDFRDELYIKIISTDEETARILSNETNDNRYSINISLVSYSVDNEGNIDFPFVGNIKVQGLTLNDTKKILEKELEPYLSNLSLIVKFVNNKVTVLGEVRNPGEFAYPEENISIFDALGLAGGIDQNGRIKKITLIRTNNNHISYHYLDLTNKNIAESPFYYLKPKDVIIVNPIRFKFWTMKATTITIILTSITTLISVMYYFNQT